MKSREAAFDATKIGDRYDDVIGRFDSPSATDDQVKMFTRYADKPCGAPCVKRLWFENRFFLGIEAWSVFVRRKWQGNRQIPLGVSLASLDTQNMRSRVVVVAITKLFLSVLVTVGVGLLIILPLHYPITTPAYQGLPAIVPIIGAVCSALGVALLLRSPRAPTHKMSSLAVGALSALAFVLTWSLTMFIVLNLKGS